MTSPDNDYTKFSRPSFSSHSDISVEGKDDKKDRKCFKAKKDLGYSHLERASSEEELVDGQFKQKSKKTGGKVFGKLKSKPKAATADISTSKAASKPQVRFAKGANAAGLAKSRRAVVDPAAQSSVASVSTAIPLRPVFGTTLKQALKNNPSHDGVPVPAVVRLCIDRVNEAGLTTEGIYRLSAAKKEIDELRRSVDFGVASDDFLVCVEPTSAAGLLKLFLRQLADHFLTHALREEFEKVVERSKSADDCVVSLKKLIDRLPAANKTLMAYLFVHMGLVADNAECNKMSLINIGLVMQPVLNISQTLLAAFLQHSVELFSDVPIKRYAPPIRATSNKLPMEFPNTVKDIEQELFKQDSLLNFIHDEIKTGCAAPSKEEELWDVQRLITQLKRELKKLKKLRGNSPLPLLDQADNRKLPLRLEMFEEKQLLAVQHELEENIDNELRTISALCDKLRVLKAEHPDSGSRKQQHSSEDANRQENEDHVTEEEWIQRCHVEEERREDLLKTIIYERNLCARLKAQIEMLQLEPDDTSVEATRL